MMTDELQKTIERVEALVSDLSWTLDERGHLLSNSYAAQRQADIDALRTLIAAVAERSGPGTARCPTCGHLREVVMSSEGTSCFTPPEDGRTWVLGCDRTGPVAGEWWICHPDSIEEERANPNVEVVTVREIGGTDGE